MIVSCGETLVDMVPDPVPGGGPMNVAVAAARLGAPSAFVGRVSTDAYGDRIWEHLVTNGVDLRACERGSEPTARAIVEHVPQLLFRFEGTDTADTRLERADLSLLGDGPHILHGGTLGLFRGRTAETLARLVESHTGLVSLDPNVRPQMIDDRDRWAHFHRLWIDRTHVYRASDEDVEWIWPGRSAESCAAELLDQRAVAVLITRGGDGVTVFTREGSLSVPSNPVDVVDTVGAGDTFVAAILASLWEQSLTDSQAVSRLPLADWRPIAAGAVAAAAITCSRRGADPPGVADLAS